MANLFLTGSGLPTLAIGEITDYYRDTGTNLIYYHSPTGWEAVPSLIPTPDGVGTTWYHGDGSPNSGLGASNDYYRDEADGTVYRKHPVNGWESKGSLDFIGVYGVQWGEGSGAPANIPPFNNLPAGSFYLDVSTSNIYYKDNTLTWSLKGQLGGGGGGGSVTIIDNLNSNSTTAALSANQGKALDSRLQTVENAQTGYGDIVTYNASAFDSAGAAAAAQAAAEGHADQAIATALEDYATKANQRYQFVSDSNTTYTVPASAVTENGRTIIELSSNSLTSITINAATGTGKVAGDSVHISITGTYAAQVLVADGVTLEGDLTFSYQYETKTLIYKGSNVWKVVG